MMVDYSFRFGFVLLIRMIDRWRNPVSILLMVFFIASSHYSVGQALVTDEENKASPETHENINHQQPYLTDGRRQYIFDALQAFYATPLRNLQNTESYIYATDRNNCQSNLSSLRLECMMNYAKDNCQSLRGTKIRLACERYSDIIIVNKLSEAYFIDKAERYRIAKNAEDGDVRQAMMARLQQKYARIVTMFAVSEQYDCANEDVTCLAKGLDNFCLDYTNRESLSWQYCVGALVWFMGTSR